MRVQREPGPPKDSDGSSRESRDPGSVASPAVAAAAAVLSAPRKWPKGSDRGPLRDSPASLAPRPPPPRGSRAAGVEVGAESQEPERLGGRAGRAHGGGGGIPRVIQARRSGCGRDRPAGPQMCPTSRLRPSAWPEARPSRVWGRRPPGRSHREFPRGRVLSRCIPGMPVGRGGRTPPLSPGPTPAAPSGRPAPQPTRAASPQPDASGHVARGREPRPRPARRQAASTSPARARRPLARPPPGLARGRRPAGEARREAHSTEALMAQGRRGRGRQGRRRGRARAGDQSVWRS